MSRALQPDAGFQVFPFDPGVAAWATAAERVGRTVLSKGGERRHGATWFVGVDALPNAPDGSVDGVPLAGAWLPYVDPPKTWHQAQLSVVLPGYPQKDPDESQMAHRYRQMRDAAHVDGLLPEGPERRRYLREPHGFILGLPLNDVSASPLVVWPGSQLMMRNAFQAAFSGHNPDTWHELDITGVYQSTRRSVFETCERVEVIAAPGQAILLDRHLVHGVAPWAKNAPGDMRMIAYFRPQVTPSQWL